MMNQLPCQLCNRESFSLPVNIVQLTPGAGAMYCGNCLRDNALVATLRKKGHQVTMVPLYLPLTLDETDQSENTPIFFSGISVYLEQQFSPFKAAPAWLRDLLSSRKLLKWAAGKAAKTRPQDVGELTLSMLRGELGNQVRDLEELIAWLKTQPAPDVICLSNVLLVGMVRRLKADLGCKVICMLQGEDWFLDSLPAEYKESCWREVSQRAAETDLLVGSSQYFSDYMAGRLGLSPEKVTAVWNGIQLEGYPHKPVSAPAVPTIGYFARMSAEKGVDFLVDAFILLRRRGKLGPVRLRIGGSCGPADEPVVARLSEKLAAEGLLDEVEFCKNLSREAKIEFLKSLSVFSVPARYGEAFGLYVVEALAAGVPVVQPRTASFPELVEATQGGLLFEAGDVEALANGLEELLLDPSRARAMGEQGRQAVWRQFSAESMANSILSVYESVATGSVPHRRANPLLA